MTPLTDRTTLPLALGAASAPTRAILDACLEGRELAWQDAVTISAAAAASPADLEALRAAADEMRRREIGDDVTYVKSIGASQVINYREAQFENILREKVDVVFDLVGGDAQKRSFLVLKESGHLVSAVQPVSQEEAEMHHVSGVMMRLAPSGDVLSRIGQLLEEETIRPDVATVYALQDAAQAWKDVAEKLPGVHGLSSSGPGAARHKSHGKIVLRVS